MAQVHFFKSSFIFETFIHRNTFVILENIVFILFFSCLQGSTTIYVLEEMTA